MDKRVIHVIVWENPAQIDVDFTSKSGKEFSIYKITKVSQHRLADLSYNNEIKTQVGLWGGFTSLHIRLI